MSTLKDEDFSEDVLQKIKQEKLSPKPKWQFLLKNSIIWGLGVLSLALGSVSMSLVFYMIKNDDAGAYGRAGSNILETLLFVIPFFWIICLTIFALAVYFYIKHTKKGYKYSAKKIILVIIGASLILGGIFSILGLGRVIDDVLGERAPFYDRVINPRLDYWSNPENGRLTGLVILKVSPTEYKLIDRSGETWATLLPDEKTGEMMVVGRPVMLVGEKVSDHKFMIKEILPVGPGRGFFKRPHLDATPRMCEPKPGDDFIPCDTSLIIPFVK